MEVALIGFKQSGKSTLLAAISGKTGAAHSSGALAKIVVPVPDARIEWLNELYKPAKKILATLECLDLPGLDFSADAERKASRKLLGEVKTADMFVLVVRAFKNDAVVPYRGSIEPLRDVKELESEFLLSDLELVLTRIERLEEALKKGAKVVDKDKFELTVQKKLEAALDAGKPAACVSLEEGEREVIKSLGLITMKPFMVVLNTDEGEHVLRNRIAGQVDASVPVVSLPAKVEQELAELDSESRQAFMQELGLSEAGSHVFVRSCFAALGLISFFTVGEDEVRAWPIRRDATALDAAGKIHTDIKRGFIRAETMAYADLHEHGDEKAVKAAGRMRLEGKTYAVQDGDIINFRFNV